MGERELIQTLLLPTWERAWGNEEEKKEEEKKEEEKEEGEK